MATSYGKKVLGTNSHIAALTSARFYSVDGSNTSQQTINPSACRLVRVTLNTNGSTVTLKDGSRGIAVIASDAPEQTFEYGIYCENSLTVQAGGAVDATVVFAA